MAKTRANWRLNLNPSFRRRIEFAVSVGFACNADQATPE